MTELDTKTEIMGTLIRPRHYSYSGLEPKDVIRAYGLNFNLGNAVKYIVRAGKKDNKTADIRKAIQYIDFELEAIKSGLGMQPIRFKGFQEYPIDKTIVQWELDNLLESALRSIFNSSNGVAISYFTECLEEAKLELIAYCNLYCNLFI